MRALQKQFTIIAIIMAHINYHPRAQKGIQIWHAEKNGIIVVKHIDPKVFHMLDSKAFICENAHMVNIRQFWDNYT